MKPQLSKPPKLAERLLAKTTDWKIRYSAMGDFEEQFNDIAQIEGAARAHWWYWCQLLCSLPAFIYDTIYWSIAMIKNYIVIAFRNLIRQKMYSFINIFGLACGLALSILIFMFVRNEFSYDTFHQNIDRIYRVWLYQNTPERGEVRFTRTSVPMGLALKETYPDLEQVVRIVSSSGTVKYGGAAHTEKISYVDDGFFELFSFPVYHGDISQPLDAPNAAVISAEIAEKYFGNQNPIGQLLNIELADSLHVFSVTAVAGNVKGKSSIEFSVLLRFENFAHIFSKEWYESFTAHCLETYVRLAPQITEAEFEAKLPAIAKVFFEKEIRENTKHDVFLQPMADIHLNTDLPPGDSPVSDPLYSYILATLGLMVLFIACVNFITLSVGKSTSRAKEVGVRKVLGAFPLQLKQQYLGEAFLMSTLAMIFGVLLAKLFLPTFNELAQQELVFSPDLTLILVLIVLTITVSLVAGFYPAVILSKFQPVAVLKGYITAFSGGTGNLRSAFLGKGLIILQFALSVFLVIATVVMYQQRSFLQAKNLGYDQERLIELSLNSPVDSKSANALFERVQTQFSQNNKVLQIAGVFNSFGDEWTTLGFNDENNNYREFSYNLVDYNFIDVMEIELIGGRNFSKEYSTDYDEALIVNEAFVNYFELDDPLNGEKITANFDTPHRIIGVVKNFHFSSLHQEIKPLALSLSFKPFSGVITRLNSDNWPPVINQAVLRVAPGETPAIIDEIRENWKQMTPDAPFEFQFVDETLEAKYQQERRWGRIINYASVFAILIACLGLFGLTTLAVERRIKEIGVRKVLGASVAGLVSLISKELLLLVAIANFIAWPAAYFALGTWLQGFAYRIDITIWSFVLASALAVLIAIVTISSRAIRAALANPIEALRHE